MKVLDVVLAAARVLCIEEGVNEYLNDGTEDYAKDTELLLTCFNNIESSLALDYVPLYAEDELRTVTGRLEFSSFTYSPVRILGVADGLGNAVPYTLYAKYIKTNPGILKVTYTYTPNQKTIDMDSDFDLMSGEHLFVYGVLSEYCLAKGMFEEAAAWDKKFKDSMEFLFHTRKCQRLSSRRWV